MLNYTYVLLIIGDIEWFKPVELRTKMGRRGHIKEPLGKDLFYGLCACKFYSAVPS